MSYYVTQDISQYMKNNDNKLLLSPSCHPAYHVSTERVVHPLKKTIRWERGITNIEINKYIFFWITELLNYVAFAYGLSYDDDHRN